VDPFKVNGAIEAASFKGDGSFLTNVKADSIADNSIDSTKIKDGSIFMNDLADGAVTDVKILGPISGDKIQGDLTVRNISASEKITAQEFQGSEFSGAFNGIFTGYGSGLTKVTAERTSLNSVNSASIIDESITGADIANNTINDSKIISISANKITGTLPSNSIPSDLNLNSIKTNLQVYLPNSIEVNSSTGITAEQLTSTVLKIRGFNGPVDMALGLRQIATSGVSEGQMLILKGRSDMGLNTVTFNTGDGLILSQGVDFTMGKDDILILILVDGTWIEVSRTDN